MRFKKENCLKRRKGDATHTHTEPEKKTKKSMWFNMLNRWRPAVQKAVRSMKQPSLLSTKTPFSRLDNMIKSPSIEIINFFLSPFLYRHFLLGRALFLHHYATRFWSKEKQSIDDFPFFVPNFPLVVISEWSTPVCMWAPETGREDWEWFHIECVQWWSEVDLLDSLIYENK